MKSRRSDWLVTVVAGGSSVVGACSDGDVPRTDVLAPSDTTENVAGAAPVASDAVAPSGGAGSTVASVSSVATGTVEPGAAPSASLGSAGAGGANRQGAGGGANGPGPAGSSDAGGGGTSSGGAGGSVAGAAGSGGTPSPAAGSGGAMEPDPSCPETLGDAFTMDDFGSPPPACPTEGVTCEFARQCSSGPQLLTVTCQGGVWELGPVGCDQPYDYCDQTSEGKLTTVSICVNGEWSLQTCPRSAACETASPCPKEPPTAGTSCMTGATGGHQDHCGYPCPDAPEKWTVFDCVDEEYPEATWYSDGVCD